MTTTTVDEGWRINPFTDPDEFDPSTGKHMLKLFAYTAVASWVSRWIALYVDVVFSYQLGRLSGVTATLLNLSHLLSKLDVNRSKKAEYQWMLFSMLVPVADYLTFGVIPSYKSLRAFILVNYFGIQRAVLAHMRLMDQQTSTIVGQQECLVTDAQLALFWSPVFGALGFVMLIMLLPASHLAFSLAVSIGEKARIVIKVTSAVLPIHFIGYCFITCANAFTSMARRLHWSAAQLKDWMFKMRQEEPLELLEYRFQPLSYRQIRILKLLKRKPLSSPRYELITVPLDEAPLYEAVSHRWENPIKYRNIIVNHTYRLKVPSRIYEFICHRSSYLSSRFVWIDSVCIYQDDLNERAEQVKIMGDIYRNATGVVAWLSSREEAPDARLMFLHLTLVDVLHIFNMHSWMPGLNATQTDGQQKALISFLNNSWFSRVWIVQEVALAKRVRLLYGSVCLEWWQLEHYKAAFENDRVGAYEPDTLNIEYDATRIAGTRALNQFSAVAMIRRRVQTDMIANEFAQCTFTGYTDKHSVWLLPREVRQMLDHYVYLDLPLVLRETLLFNATDSRDRIFALLGTIQMPKARLPIPDYHSSFDDVYFEMAKLILGNEPYGVSLLTRAGVGLYKIDVAHALQSLPSWVPNLLTDESLAGLVVKPGLQYSAIRIKTMDGSKVIKIRATLIDHLVSVGPFSESDIFQEDLWEHPKLGILVPVVLVELASWLLDTKSYVQDRCRNPLTSTIEQFSKSQEAAFWRTIFTNRLDGYSFPPEDELTFERIELFCHLAFTDVDWSRIPRMTELGLVTQNGSFRNEVIWALNLRLMKSLIGTSFRRRFSITHKGRFTLVPPLSRPGDIVCVLEDLEDPFLLRATDDENYQLVGACYVDELAISDEERVSRFQEISII